MRSRLRSTSSWNSTGRNRRRAQTRSYARGDRKRCPGRPATTPGGNSDGAAAAGKAQAVGPIPAVGPCGTCLGACNPNGGGAGAFSLARRQRTQFRCGDRVGLPRFVRSAFRADGAGMEAAATTPGSERLRRTSSPRRCARRCPSVQQAAIGRATYCSVVVSGAAGGRGRGGARASRAGGSSGPRRRLASIPEVHRSCATQTTTRPPVAGRLLCGEAGRVEGRVEGGGQAAGSPAPRGRSPAGRTSRFGSVSAGQFGIRTLSILWMTPLAVK